MFSKSNNDLKKTSFLLSAHPRDIINWGHQHNIVGKKTMDLVGIHEILCNYTLEQWNALAEAIRISKVEGVDMACNSLGFLPAKQWDCFCKSFEGIGLYVKRLNFNSNDFDKLHPEQLQNFRLVIAGTTILSFRFNYLCSFSSEQLYAWGGALHGIQALDLVGNSFHKFSVKNLENLNYIFKKTGIKSINFLIEEFSDEYMSNEIRACFCNMLTHTSVTEILSSIVFPYGDDDQLKKGNCNAYFDLYFGSGKIKKIMKDNLSETKRRLCLTFLSGKSDMNADTPLFKFFREDGNQRLRKNILEYAELPLPKNLGNN